MLIHISGRGKHEPIVHLRGSEIHPKTLFEPQPDDPEHRGEKRNYWGPLYVSADRLLDVGYQEFSGKQWNPTREGYEQIIVILSGSGELTCEGQTYRFRDGDVIIHDCPLPEKTLRSEGFRAVYIARFRTPEARDKIRPDLSGGGETMGRHRDPR